MPVLGDVLFPPADQRRTTLSILNWWESRRLLFNVVVGVAGLFTLLVVRMILSSAERAKARLRLGKADDKIICPTVKPA